MLWIFTLWSMQPARRRLSSHFTPPSLVYFSPPHLLASHTCLLSRRGRSRLHLNAKTKFPSLPFHSPSFRCSLRSDNNFITLMYSQQDDVYIVRQDHHIRHAVVPLQVSKQTAFQQLRKRTKTSSGSPNHTFDIVFLFAPWMISGLLWSRETLCTRYRETVAADTKTGQKTPTEGSCVLWKL